MISGIISSIGPGPIHLSMWEGSTLMINGKRYVFIDQDFEVTDVTIQ